MKKPNIDRFVPSQKQRIKPETVDFSGAPAIKAHPGQTIKPPSAQPTPPPPSSATPNEQVVFANKQTSNMANKQAILFASNIAILQTDLERYILTAYKAQTFRFTPDELKRLKDLSYNISNTLDRKIGQADLLRLGLLLLEKHLDVNREAVLAILQASK
jgi:hypothetical protein